MNDLDQMSKRHDKEALRDALQITRQEPGIPLEEISHTILDTYTRPEAKFLIEELVSGYGKKYGSRLYQ